MLEWTAIPSVKAGATLIAAAGFLASAPTTMATTCDRTTELMAQACAHDREDDNLVALAICANFKDAGEQERCAVQASNDLNSATALCAAQEQARARLCSEVKILGIKCAVVLDTVYVDGEIEEDTEDYYAQDREGNVWYFGEATAEYVDGRVTSVDGSFIAGEAGAKPGIIMPAHPAPGVSLRQEAAMAEAEDAARYESLGGQIKVPAGIFRRILKTLETTPLEPTARENKYYAPGVGLILTVNLETGERERLISMER